MRAGGGKSKGAQFERDICKRLSLWISADKHEDVFWRSSMSGGRSTVAFARGKRLAAQAGDISSIHPLGHTFIEKYLLECKTYRDLDYVGLLSKRGKLVQFWQEATRQAKLYDKKPVLIAKQNQQPITICVGYGLAEQWKLRPVLRAPRLNLCIALFDDFLKSVKYERANH